MTHKKGDSLLGVLYFLLIIDIIYFLTALYISDYPPNSTLSTIFFYFSIYTQYFIPFVLIFLATKSIGYLILNRDQGFAGLSKCWNEIFNIYVTKKCFIRIILILATLPVFNFSYNTIKQLIPIAINQTYDLQLHRVDYFIHGNQIPWNLMQGFIGHPLITRFIDYCYLLWGTLYLFTIFWMGVSRRSFLRIHYFSSLAACWILAGNVMAKFLASAGPCFFDKVTDTSNNPYQPMMVYLHTIPNLKAIHIQNFLWHARSQDILIPWGGISAMPSMHVSIAVLTALAFSNINRMFALIMCAFALIIQIGSVHLGSHYAVDGYISALTTVAIWFTIKKLLLYLGLKNPDSRIPQGPFTWI